MQIHGVGIDIVSNQRIHALITQYADRFLKKVFSALEIECAKSKFPAERPAYFAKRFAGKEAFVKALGTPVDFTKISILNNVKGAPYIALDDGLAKYVVEILNSANYEIHLSLSDEKEYSVAQCVIVR